MESLIEQAIIYTVVFLLIGIAIFIYLRKQIKESKEVGEKIKIAKEEGLHEPVSLHPVIDVNSCIKSGACTMACPEKDILGIRNGKATVINASQCIGHGACFHACPTQSITLCIGTEKRGVEIPHVSEEFETNIEGIYIAGEMGGMGLIKNAVEQGKQAVSNLAIEMGKHASGPEHDLIVVGAGPAGIGATLQAKKLGLSCLTLEQDTLGGTVYTFPRSKIVMTAPMDLPLFGKVKLYETNKEELLNLWNKALDKNDLSIHPNCKVEGIKRIKNGFQVTTSSGEVFNAKKILLAIGRRGTPRKLNIPGEVSPKVAYRLLEPEVIKDKSILVVGGGDSAIEAALMLMDNNEVTLSYRKDKFSRLKPKNREKIKMAIEHEKINCLFNSNLIKIEDAYAHLKLDSTNTELKLNNEMVYIFAGGELPTQFLNSVGIKITKKFGEALLSHKK